MNEVLTRRLAELGAARSLPLLVRLNRHPTPVWLEQVKAGWPCD